MAKSRATKTAGKKRTGTTSDGMPNKIELRKMVQTMPGPKPPDSWTKTASREALMDFVTGGPMPQIQTAPRTNGNTETTTKAITTGVLRRVLLSLKVTPLHVATDRYGKNYAKFKAPSFEYVAPLCMLLERRMNEILGKIQMPGIRIVHLKRQKDGNWSVYTESR